MTQAFDNRHMVWLVDDDPSIRWVLERALSNAGFEIITFETGSSALSRYKRIPLDERPQLILTDIRMPGISGFELLKQIKNLAPTQPVIIMTAYSDLDTTVQGYQKGAFEYLPKPFDIDEAIELVTRACESQTHKPHSSVNHVIANEMIGESQPMRSLYRTISKLSTCSNHIHINGEIGTGKSLVARTVHLKSSGSATPLLQLNVTASTNEQDLVNLLSPAKQLSKVTLLLTNIDALSKQAQTRLMQLLGRNSPSTAPTSLRVISTTRSNLASLVQSKVFDPSLYLRLNEVTLTLIPLRERPGDIAVLIEHFTNRFCKELNEDSKSIDPKALAFLEQFEWHGNVSQLKNLCRRLSVSSANTISLDDLPAEFYQKGTSESWFPPVKDVSEWQYQLRIWAMKELAAGHNKILVEATVCLEKTLIDCALQSARGRKHEAAKLLGWGRNTLTRKLKKQE